MPGQRWGARGAEDAGVLESAFGDGSKIRNTGRTERLRTLCPDVVDELDQVLWTVGVPQEQNDVCEFTHAARRNGGSAGRGSR